MWERGDKVAAIAEALGCEVSAVNVARARFGLKPRRVVPGRPRQVPDEPAHKIKRVALTVSRLVEYCNEKELVAQTKASSGRASSSKSYAITPLTPARKRRSRRTLRSRSRAASRRASSSRTMVPAFRPPPSQGSSTTTSASRRGEAYISPTRGRQGNALKSILPMSYVVDGKVRGETWIEARGIKHRLVFSVNQIKQEPLVKDIRSRSRIRTGT